MTDTSAGPHEKPAAAGRSRHRVPAPSPCRAEGDPQGVH